MKSLLVRSASRIFFVLALALTLIPPQTAAAQSGGAYYTVQEGDTLYSIARSFHCSTTSIIRSSNLSNPDVLSPGRKLFIPGFEDLSGEIVRTSFPAGETAHTLSRSLRQGSDAIARLNFLTAPDALYTGQRFYELAGSSVEQTRLPLTSGLSSIELAVRTSTNPWLAAVYNDLRGPWSLVQNDTIFFPGTLAINPSADLLALSSVAVNPSPLEQGKTTVIQVKAPANTTLSGSLFEYPLHFFPDAQGGYTALQGVPRLQDPGLAEFILTLSTADGRSFAIQQNLLVKQMDYGFDSPLEVSDDTVDPEVTVPEFNQIMSVVADAPPEKMWYSAFQPPIPNPERITSYYGRLRSYNGSTYDYFHSGLDYAGNETTPVLAAAPGIVVFAGALTVRGNATIISHGWGVYTGYWHQSHIDVKVGDRVDVGQQIGMVGMTGRVTGPHLHYDLIVGSVEVDPEPWFTSVYAGF
jgi:murein DD-endopeptidase MepM/ murein hydrolase activator NlpD